MRFTESRKKLPWVKGIILIVILALGALSFCEFRRTQKTVQKTIVFEAD